MLAHGTRWSREFEGLRVLIRLRQGDLDAAHAHWQAASGDAARDSYTMIASAEVLLERTGKLTTELADGAVAHIEHDYQMLWIARATQAAVRTARREPKPMRDLPEALGTAERMGVRFGWEELLLVLARSQPDLARQWYERLAPLWPTYRRGVAVHSYVEGLLAGHRGYQVLRRAAGQFDEIGEPVTAARALHAAAKVAPTIAEGNQLRRRAVETLQRCGADRSLAAIIRERRLHRGPGKVDVPDSQRHVAAAALTERERQVALLAAEGYTSQEIADVLHIAIGTVRNHLFAVRQKLGGVPKRGLVRLLGRTRTVTR